MALNDPMSLAIIAKQRYKATSGVDLNISDESLAQEIYWHAYCYSNGILVDRTVVSNCGESEGDSNRWLWDVVAGFSQ